MCVILRRNLISFGPRDTKSTLPVTYSIQTKSNPTLPTQTFSKQTKPYITKPNLDQHN